MAIAFSRIDDRLLHGQVVTTWLKKYDIEQVIIISAEVAKDILRQTILKTVAPKGVKVVFFDPDKFVEVYHATTIKRTTMLLFTNPTEVAICIRGGVKIPLLNVGNMSKTPTNKKITAGVAVIEQDLTSFSEIISNGTSVVIQMVPNDKTQDMQEFLK